MRPMLGWKVIEGKQDFFIFLQTFAGLWKFDLVTGDELSRKLPEPLCGSAPGTFHGSVAWLCPEHFSAFYPVCWPSYAPSTAAALLSPYSSCRAIQNPSEPSPMASFGAVESPKRLSCPSSSRQDWALSRYPSTTANNSLVPSSVAPIKTSTQVRSSSSRTLK